MFRYAFLAAAAGYATGQTSLGDLYASQTASNTALGATSLVSSLNGAVSWSVSGAWGTRDGTNAMLLSTPGRVNTVVEMIVVASFILAAQEAGISVTSTLNTAYVPSGTYSNQGVAITYEMLMRHTSSLSDTNYGSYLITTSCTPSTGTCTGSGVTDFVTWLNATGVTSLFQSTVTPGTYSYSPYNTALLVYIMNAMVNASAISVTNGAESTGFGYMYSKVIQPLGLSSTLFLNLDGTIPAVMGISSFWNSIMIGTYYLHPNRYADVMPFSSVEDLNKLAVYASTCTSCGFDTMRSATQTTASSSDGYQTGQGYGLQYFDPEKICEATINSGVYTACPLSSDDLVWGHVAIGSTTVAAVLCTDSYGVNQPACVSIIQGFDAASSVDSTTVYAMAGGAFQETFGEVTVAATSGNDNDDDLYGLWVCLGVVGTIGFVVAASYFTEFLIQPPPPVGPGPFRPGQNPQTGDQYQAGY